jgi:hypothetical protein
MPPGTSAAAFISTRAALSKLDCRAGFSVLRPEIPFLASQKHFVMSYDIWEARYHC